MEYIIDVPDRHSVCADCDRNPCVEIGCEAAPVVFTGRRERIVRCRDCKHCKPMSNFHKHLGCYNDFLNKHEVIPVCEEGFCAWGERRG